MACSKSTKGARLQLDSRVMGRAAGGETEERWPERLGPPGLGEGFGFHSGYTCQPLQSLKGHTLFHCFKQDDSGWSGF